jgi:hypothetical protein
MLVLSVADVEAVIAEKGRWTNVMGEIGRLCKSSKTGQALFGFAYTNIVCESVSKCIDEQLETLRGKQLDTKAVDRWEKHAADKLSSLVDLAALPAKRVVSMTYRGCSFDMVLGTARQEMEVKLQILIKHAAVHNDMVPSLTFESELVDKAVAPTLAGVTDSLVDATKKARETANALLEQARLHGAEGIKQVLNAKEVHLLTVQREFSVEIGLLRSMMGEGGKTRVEQAILDALPSQSKPDAAAKPASSLHAVTALQGSPLYSFVPAQVQQTVVSTRELLHAICNATTPRIDPSRATSFMKLVLKRCESFVVEPKVSKQSGQQQYAYGAEALMLKFSKLEAAASSEGKGQLTLKDLDIFKSFEWLLPQDAQRKLKTITDEICANAGIMVAAMPSFVGQAESESSSKAAAVSKKRKAEVMHAASELFS